MDSTAIATWAAVMISLAAFVMTIFNNHKLQKAKLYEKWGRISSLLREMNLYLGNAAQMEGYLSQLWSSGIRGDPNEGRWMSMVESSLKAARNFESEIINILRSEKGIPPADKKRIQEAINLDYISNSRPEHHAAHARTIDKLNSEFVLSKIDPELRKVSSLRDSGS